MIKKRRHKSVATTNRYESMRRKAALDGSKVVRLFNRKESTAEMAATMKRRDQMVAAKQYEFARSNGFTHVESRIAQNRKAKEAKKLEIIKSKDGVAMILREIKVEKMEALSYSKE